MTAKDIRRLMRRELDDATRKAAERNERVAWHAIRLLRAGGSWALMIRS